MSGRGRSLVVGALVALSPTLGLAQTGDVELRRALDLERRAQYDAAAEAYLLALTEHPANLSALLGLERVLGEVGRLDRLVPFTDSALVLQPHNRRLRALQLRVWAALAEPDSVTAAAKRWIALAPDSPEPYREWAQALAQSGDAQAAHRILTDGMDLLGDPALSQDMAELALSAGEWDAAARLWRDVVRWNPALVPAAAASLSRIPAPERERVLQVLSGDGVALLDGRLVAELLVEWSRPVEGWEVLSRSLPSESSAAAALLRRFADRSRVTGTPEGSRASGLALERLAKLAAGPAAERARLDAARAFAAAGDSRSAERVLRDVSVESGDEGRAADAMGTLIGLMAQSGKVDEAERHFREWEDRLSGDDAAWLRNEIAASWIREGDLDRAEGVLAGDSTITTFALRGHIALYRGDLRTATALFQRAGPGAGGRSAATQRTAFLALIQQIQPDTAPQVGHGLFLLATGDSLRGVNELERAAAGLPAAGGRGDVLAFAGAVAAGVRQPGRAERLLLAALEADPEGAAAPAARFHLASAYVQLGREDDAVRQLEELILTHPGSALVPQARRLLDHVRGGVPPS